MSKAKTVTMLRKTYLDRGDGAIWGTDRLELVGDLQIWTIDQVDNTTSFRLMLRSLVSEAPLDLILYIWTKLGVLCEEPHIAEIGRVRITIERLPDEADD